MQVKVLRGFCIGNGVDVQPGDVIELSEKEARIKIKQGKVKNVNTPEKSKAAREAAKNPLLYKLKEALELISLAQSEEEINEIIQGDTREKVLEAAEKRKSEIKGGDENA